MGSSYLKNKNIFFVILHNCFNKYIFKAFPKGKEAVEYGIDLVIDDTLEVIEDVRNHNVEALQYGVDVKNWYEVINFVRRKLDGQNIRCK